MSKSLVRITVPITGLAERRRCRGAKFCVVSFHSGDAPIPFLFTPVRSAVTTYYWSISIKNLPGIDSHMANMSSSENLANALPEVCG